MNPQDHRGQKRRLRTRQVIRPVRVQDRSVVLDLVDEVVDHVAGKRQLVILEQADLDEVTVPAVHFIEASAWHHVGSGQIQQAVLLDAGGVLGERGQRNRAEFFLAENLAQRALYAGPVLPTRDVDRPGCSWRQVQFWIDRGGRQVAIRAGQRRPRGLDVLSDRVQLWCRWQPGLTGNQPDQAKSKKQHRDAERGRASAEATARQALRTGIGFIMFTWPAEV